MDILAEQPCPLQLLGWSSGKDESMKPLVIAHRGASRDEPENTLRAFETAIRQGAQMIEMDLQITGDGQVIVLHDETLDHTTDRKGRVDRLTLSEIKQADAGKGERIPTLTETLDLTLGQVRLYLEIKDPRAARPTLETIRARRCEADVMLASFDLNLMRDLGREIADIELGLILGSESWNPLIRWREAFPWVSLRKINYQVLSLQAAICYPYLARKIKRQGKKLFVWTVDEPAEISRLIDLGVDGIVTNVPGMLSPKARKD